MPARTMERASLRPVGPSATSRWHVTGMNKTKTTDPDRTPLLGAFIIAVVALVTLAAASTHLLMR